MTVSTIYGIAGDGYCGSTNATYLTARSGGSLSAGTADGNNVVVGQTYNGSIYGFYEGFIGFDTSVVSTDTVSVATLSLWLLTDESTTEHTQQARVQTWSAGGLTTADFVAGASLTQALLASISTSGIGATGAYKSFTSEADFLANINGSGNTEIILCTDNQAAGTPPSGTNAERMHWDDADAAGTTQDPKLVVTHAPAATEVTPSTLATTTATFAPGIGSGVTPGVLANTLTSYAPSLTEALASPATLALLTELFAPSTFLGTPVLPDSLATVLTAYAPLLLEELTPAQLALVTELFAPTAPLSTIIDPNSLALILASFAPELWEYLTTDVLNTSLTGYAPEARLSFEVTPDPLSLTTTGFAPLFGYGFTPGEASLVITTYDPSVGLTTNTTIPVANLTTTGSAPSIGYGYVPSTLALVLSPLTPFLMGSPKLLIRRVRAQNPETQTTVAWAIRRAVTTRSLTSGRSN